MFEKAVWTIINIVNKNQRVRRRTDNQEI